MTNEEKAQRLEEIAQYYIRLGDKDAALLRECAAIWREQPDPEWDVEYTLRIKRHDLIVWPSNIGVWKWRVVNLRLLATVATGQAITIPAAQAAAVAWVDAQEGK
jgi:hypothetical protein